MQLQLIVWIFRASLLSKLFRNFLTIVDYAWIGHDGATATFLLTVFSRHLWILV